MMNKSSSINLKVKLKHELRGHNSAIYALSPYKDEGSFLSAAGDGWIVEWTVEDPENGRLIAKTNSNIFSMHYSKADHRVTVGDIMGDLHVVFPEESDKAKKITYHKKGVFGIISLADDILSLAGDGMLTRWSTNQFQKKESFQLSYHRIRGSTILKKHNLIVIGSSDKNIYFLDTTSFKIRNVIKLAHENSVFCLAHSADERYLLSGGRDAILKVWDLQKDFELVKALPAHLFTINAIRFSPDNKLIVTASRDKTIKFWDSSNFKLLKVLESIRDDGHVNSVNDLMWLSKNRLISCSDDRTIKIWDVDY